MSTQLGQFGWRRRMTQKGQIERLPRPGLSARYVIRQETLAGARGNGRDAPVAVVRGATSHER